MVRTALILTCVLIAIAVALAFLVNLRAERFSDLVTGTTADCKSLTSEGRDIMGCSPDRTVKGNLQVDNNALVKGIFDTQGLRFTKKWSGYPDNKTDGSEISNDTSTYKALMVVGNRSAGQGVRKVGIWDVLDVHGRLNVSNQFCIGSTCISESDLKTIVSEKTEISTLKKQMQQNTDADAMLARQLQQNADADTALAARLNDVKGRF